MDEILDILIEGLFGHRRGLLKQVAADDLAIEKLQTLKENRGKLGKTVGFNIHGQQESDTIEEADKLE